MEARLDPVQNFKNKRGNTLKTLSILSWIWMAFTLVSLVFSVSVGPKTAEELDEDKAELMASYTDEMMELMGGMLDDSIEIMEVSNAHFYSLALTSFFTVLIGFIGVLWMYRLQKKGYYLYVIYSLIPILSILVLYRDTYLLLWGSGLHIIIGGLFCLLYGFQLKRMS